MHDHNPSDPWASLAESLGVGPSGDAAPKPPAAPKPASPPRTERRPARPAAGPKGDWDSLASELGIGGTEPAPVRPRPVERPPVHTEERSDRFEDRAETPRPMADRELERAPRADGEHGEEDRPRGRRRRGRRGGRGRREREHSADRRVEGGDRPETEARRAEPFADDDGFTRAAEDRDREPIGDRDSEPLREPREPRAADADAGEDGDRAPRRRRRGRRGGRGRGRGERSESGAERGRSEREPVSVDDSLDHEPLPTSYGMRPTTSRADEAATDRDRPAGARGEPRDDEGSGGTRGRRRRRRRRGSEGRATSGESRGEARPAGTAREGGASSREGRRDRRRRGRGEGEQRSSGFSRGRRGDFAPVAGGYDEDDEGLEFLGVEEAVREPGRRETRPEDDDVLAESGLTSVLDVPSWVEAIGIVIAGNLDARNRSGRQDGGRGR